MEIDKWCQNVENIKNVSKWESKEEQTKLQNTCGSLTMVAVGEPQSR